MAAQVQDVSLEIHEISPTEAREIFDSAAQYYLKMSGEEFLKRWEAGKFEELDQPDVMHVAVLMPLVRP